ncbi:MAG: polyketide cyclase [Alistipes sp.]|nr:polyketide cyclase [Alistipes sp.]
MEKYESKQQQINHPASLIFPIISRMDLMTPAIQDKVEEWEATEDSCSFKVKGMKVSLRIAEKVENKHVKIVAGEGGLPIDFSFWIQLKEVAERDTRIRMVLHAELNMMMRMMLGSKIQQGLDQAVEGLATALNSFR